LFLLIAIYILSFFIFFAKLIVEEKQFLQLKIPGSKCRGFFV